MPNVGHIAPLLVLLVLCRAVFAEAMERSVPAPLPGHPGNVFLAGEEVSIGVPAGAVTWRAADCDGTGVGRGLLLGMARPWAWAGSALGGIALAFWTRRGNRSRGPLRL